MNTVPKKRDTREWTWGDGEVRPRPDPFDSCAFDARLGEPSRLERFARMRSARLLEPSRRAPRSA
jgi:hypothetical protein